MMTPVAPTLPAFAGFDTSAYPGDHAMSVWKQASPYVFAAYYLRSPCHHDAGWTGRRVALKAMGWNLAPVYVGQQAAGASPCSSSLLTAGQGQRDALDCGSKMAAEGFARGVYTYLDIEHVDQFSEPSREYVAAWTAALTGTGFRPGIYCHEHNVGDVRAAVCAGLASSPAVKPRFWIAGGAVSAFDLNRCHPSACGIPYADLWQCPETVTRDFGGIKIAIDEDVAALRDPSAPEM